MIALRLGERSYAMHRLRASTSKGEWGGLLPAPSASEVRYLAAHGARLTASTLRKHLAALAQWHQQCGFVEPTKAVQMRDTLRGIQALHPQPVKQAPGLQLQVLEASIEGLKRCVAQCATRATDDWWTCAPPRRRAWCISSARDHTTWS